MTASPLTLPSREYSLHSSILFLSLPLPHRLPPFRLLVSLAQQRNHIPWSPYTITSTFTNILTSFHSYIPWSEEKGEITSCGIPINYYASKEWADKKVILFALPGAFTPVCSARHVPEYVEKLPEIRAKGVDVVAVLAYNDAYVMSAWGKANQVTNDDIVRSPSSFLICPSDQ